MISCTRNVDISGKTCDRLDPLQINEKMNAKIQQCFEGVGEKKIRTEVFLSDTSYKKENCVKTMVRRYISFQLLIQRLVRRFVLFQPLIPKAIA